MIGHDDPLATMSLDEINAAYPVDPSTLPPADEFLAHLKGLATAEEREWFRARVLDAHPQIARGPLADEFVAFTSGLAINARDNGIPFRWVRDSMMRCNGWSADDHPDLIAARERILEAVEIMSKPGWRPR